MALTFTDLSNKFVRLSRDTTPGTLTQGQQDINQGYQLFNAKLSRYFSRKQQFTDTIEGQSIYQTPIDSVRIIGMTVATADGVNSYSPPVKEIRSEYEWRLIKTVPNYASNWTTYYFMLGNDELEIWPVPSSSIPNGIRFYYQQQDHFLTVSDIVSGELSPVQTCTMVNGSVTVTSTGSTFTTQLIGLSFQITGQTDNTWYEIVGVPTSSTLTLKSAYVGTSGSSLSFRIGQVNILPGEYHTYLVDYALGLFFSGKGNETRSQFHMSQFNNAVDDAVSQYSSSTEGNVISDADNFVSPWLLTPLPPTGS